MTGTIKRIVADKGFGFIGTDDGGKDVFFHSTSVVGGGFNTLKVGDKVSFDVEDSEKGPRAVNVTVSA